MNAKVLSMAAATEKMFWNRETTVVKGADCVCSTVLESLLLTGKTIVHLQQLCLRTHVLSISTALFSMSLK